MKNLLCLAILALVLTGCKSRTANNYDDSENEYVYVTPYGEKYHTEDCYILNGRETRELSIEEAEAELYEPCKLCHD